MISQFDAFNIIYVPHSQNFGIDLLANVASMLIPTKKKISHDKFSIELILDHIFLIILQIEESLIMMIKSLTS